MSAAFERVSIAGPAGAIEAVAEDCAAAGRCYAVICHPHPLYGGTMDNKVVTTTARALRDGGVPTLRFNFRGVGASAGSYDQGDGETNDAQAVAAWGDARWPGRSLVIAGFSFGGYVALRLAGLHEPRLLITIAPAISLLDGKSFAAPQCPWLVIQGAADELVDAAHVSALVNRTVPKPKLVLLPGVGHFFHGNLQELRDTVAAAIRNG
jgi:alpha/beta superfamily hydrolase